MGDHVFLDESKRDVYVMVSVALPAGRLATLRRAAKGAQVPGTRRLHFRAERDSVRKAFVSTLVDHSVTADVYAAPGRPDLAAREDVLAAVVRDAVARSAERLVFERDESVLVHDERVIKRERARLGAADTLRYDALPAVAEPLLWIPDAIAWAWCRSPDWRRRVQPLVSTVVSV